MPNEYSQILILDLILLTRLDDLNDKINLNGTPMISLDISASTTTSSLSGGSSNKISNSKKKKHEKRTDDDNIANNFSNDAIPVNKRQPRSLNTALDVVAENDELRQKLETENSRLKFYNQVLTKGIKRMSLEKGQN